MPANGPWPRPRRGSHARRRSAGFRRGRPGPRGRMARRRFTRMAMTGRSRAKCCPPQSGLSQGPRRSLARAREAASRLAERAVRRGRSNHEKRRGARFRGGLVALACWWGCPGHCSSCARMPRQRGPPRSDRAASGAPFFRPRPSRLAERDGLTPSHPRCAVPAPRTEDATAGRRSQALRVGRGESWCQGSLAESRVVAGFW